MNPHAPKPAAGAGAVAVNAYGYYDPGTREYVITRPDTPTPWINYLGQGRYGGIISNTAGGFSFDRDPRDRRVSRYRYNSLPPDQPGRYVYLRRTDTGEYWGATWQPVRADLDSYECRHGAGYTRITTEKAGIRAEILYFVPPTPPDDLCPVELWVLHLANSSQTCQAIQVFSYVELSFIDASSDLHNLDWSQHILSSRYDQDLNAIVAGTRFSPTAQFFASDRRPLGYDSDREAFVGPYRGLEDPVAVVAGRSGGSEAPRGNNVGSFCHEVVLEPGAEDRIVYVLGITDTPGDISRVIRRYRDPAEVALSFEVLGSDWDAYFEAFSVQTPDVDTTAMLNCWSPLQCRTALHWSRFVSGYETGLGRGIGTRDTAQDTLGVVHAAPVEVASRIERLWEMQFADGHTWHQFFPFTGKGGPGLAAERPTWPQWFCDDHLWLVIATCAYLKETGDYAYLQQRVAYARGEAVGSPSAVSGSDEPGHAAQRRHDPGAHVGCLGLHSCQSRPARFAEIRLCRLGRHLECRPRLGSGRERLVCDAILPRHAGPVGAGRTFGTPGGGGALSGPAPRDGTCRQRLCLGWVVVRTLLRRRRQAPRGVLGGSPPYQPDPTELVRDRRGCPTRAGRARHGLGARLPGHAVWARA